MEIIERPYNCSFSKNDIRYIFQLDELERVNLRLQVKLLYSPAADGAAFTELYTFLLKPDNNGYVHLYIQEYLNSVLSYVLPTPTQVLMIDAGAQACAFTVHFRELSDGVDVPDYDTTEEDAGATNYRLYCIKGGIEKWKHSRNNYFKNIFNVSHPFLTWQPQGRFVDKNEVMYLSVLNPAYTGLTIPDNLSLRIVFTDRAGATYTLTTSFGFAALLYHIRLNLQQLNLGTVSYADLYSMGVYYFNNATNVTYSSFLFYFEYRPVYAYYDLVLHNSLGGMESVRVKGDVVESFDRQTTDADAGALNDITTTMMSAEAIYASITLNRQYKGDIGYLREKTRQYAFMELLASKSVYMPFGSRFIPVNAIQKSQDLGTRKADLNSFPIEWQLSESNEVFTPFELEPGFGDTETADNYEPPPCEGIDVVSSSVPHAAAGESYIATVTLSGSQPFTLSGITKPAWINSITVTGNIITIAGTPLDGDVGTDNNHVQFTINNCSGVPYPIGTFITVDEGEAAEPSLTETSNTDTGPGGTRTQVFAVGSSVTAGDTFRLTVYSHDVIVTAIAGDTPTSIATKLTNAVNDTTTTQWNDHSSAPSPETNGYPPSAISSGANVTVILNYQNQFGCHASH